MKVLVTGAAGFIGSAVSAKLKAQGHEVLGLDSISDYYAQNLKRMRIAHFLTQNEIEFEKVDIALLDQFQEVYKRFNPDAVIHLAAQAGVRTPNTRLTNYAGANLLGFTNVLQTVVESNTSIFLYASSSSVYGNNSTAPYSENERNLNPTSFYGASKLANEIFVKSVLTNSSAKVAGMRFFTVYGPWGRPDMAYFRILTSVLTGEKFKLFGNGSIKRDFTYIDDTVLGIVALLDNVSKIEAGKPEIFNIGGGKPATIGELIIEIEGIAGSTVKQIALSEISGDVRETIANPAKLQEFTGFTPQISLENGLKHFYAWATEEEIAPRLQEWVSSTP
jgi:UDP-glucuronate 4-epimerase